MGGTFSLSKDRKNEYYFYSAGDNNKQSSTCVVEMLYKKNAITITNYNSICFGHKFNEAQLNLMRIADIVDNNALINQIFKKRDSYKLITDAVIYNKIGNDYIETNKRIPKGEIIMSFSMDDGYRSFYYLDENKHLVDGWIKDNNALPNN